MSDSTTTTDHDEIRQWVEARDGKPAVVRTSGKGGILRIDFGEPEEELEPIGWDEFFRIFDANDIAFLHAEDGDSRFNKFVAKESADG